VLFLDAELVDVVRTSTEDACSLFEICISMFYTMHAI
jgi:hypothetical protein